MKHCIKCNMPDTRPGSVFNEAGVCQACLNYEDRKNIDWDARKTELRALCDQYRRTDGEYDCIIPVSGGKDSHMLVYRMKVEMGMNPLLVTVADPFTKTEAGTKNLENLRETFNCDHYLFSLSQDLFRRATRLAFEKHGEPLQFVEAAIYAVPFKLAQKLWIPIVVFGEDSSYLYGSAKAERIYANEAIMAIFDKIDVGSWLAEGFSRAEVNAIVPPTGAELADFQPNVLFMSYFVPWSSIHNLQIAKRHGFRGVHGEWDREGYADDFEQIDSLAYIIHLWLKYPKFGFQRPSDILSRRVREGLVSLDDAKVLMKNDHMIDQRALDDFCHFCGYSAKEFWDVVERFWNPEIFEKHDGVWTIKASFYES